MRKSISTKEVFRASELALQNRSLSHILHYLISPGFFLQLGPGAEMLCPALRVNLNTLALAK